LRTLALIRSRDPLVKGCESDVEQRLRPVTSRPSDRREHQPLARPRLRLSAALVRFLHYEDMLCCRSFDESSASARFANIGRLNRRVRFSRAKYDVLESRLALLTVSRHLDSHGVDRTLRRETRDIEAASGMSPVGVRSIDLDELPLVALSRPHSARVIVKTLRPPTLATRKRRLSGSLSPRGDCPTLSYRAIVFS
jgi:hypothetical protein